MSAPELGTMVRDTRTFDFLAMESDLRATIPEVRRQVEAIEQAKKVTWKTMQKEITI